MNWKILAIIATIFVVPGCQTSVVSNPQAVQSLAEQECAIYVAAEKRLAAEGRPADGLSTGCAAATSPADIAPTGVAGQSTSFSEILFRRMIARGMPQDLAAEISTSPAFKELVRFQAANAS
ncbi:hypothetical protein [Palleronia sp. THAF1]|uniref:hypothetical protein n=1 Tax=Palleronia sp. THAF1 TaxID=2587842 RepID=UPI000F536403|nr:hypothetical protein [Palleronia sp. THAF1]